MKEIREAGDDLSALKSKGRTLGATIDMYVTDRIREVGRTKEQLLRSIKEYDIADMPCNEIQSHHLVEFAKSLGATRTPATVGNYMSHLSSVFALARPAWEIPLDQQAMKDAFVVCTRLGITRKAIKRDHHPSLDELNRLPALFADKHRRRPKSLPMDCIVAFTPFSTRRKDEITRVTWNGLNQTYSRAFVNDMKHPGDKVGNDVWCDLPAQARATAQAMPKNSPIVLPNKGDTISATFTRARKLLAIDDLRFHDLRHEGLTRLFEIGETIP